MKLNNFTEYQFLKIVSESSENNIKKKKLWLNILHNKFNCTKNHSVILFIKFNYFIVYNSRLIPVLHLLLELVNNIYNIRK